MKLIAHRGFWTRAEEKNSLLAFERALDHGYGIETDFRDANGVLVISHDPPVNAAILAHDFFALCQSHPVSAPHAINVKADGLHDLMRNGLKDWSLDSYFVFDMSVPDSLGYLKNGSPVFLRCSEYEVPAQELLHQAKGIWLDAFEREWYESDLINNFMAMEKAVCIVSPELHKRPHLAHWARLRDWGFHLNAGAMLCTDFPSEAEEFFRE